MTESSLNFDELKDRWNGLLIYASQRYEIDIMSSEDIYQESLIVLFKVAQKINPDTNPDDFRKMFKTELYHKLSDIVDTYKAQKRDFRKLVSGDSRMRFSDGEGDTLLSVIEDRSVASPEDYTQALYTEELLMSKLETDQKRLFKQLVNPNTFRNVNDVMEEERKRSGMRVTRNKIPMWAHARCLGWSYSYTKRVVSSLRRAVAEILEATDDESCFAS